jgi:hypothetical protein
MRCVSKSESQFNSVKLNDIYNVFSLDNETLGFDSRAKGLQHSVG